MQLNSCLSIVLPIFHDKSDCCLFSMTNQQIYDISDDVFRWFLTTCGKKWKEFKSTLKKQYFDENITNAQLKAMHAGRVNDDD